jgi:MFS family permease
MFFTSHWFFTSTGFLNIAFGAGQAMGAPLGGFMVDSIGWRW